MEEDGYCLIFQHNVMEAKLHDERKLFQFCLNKKSFNRYMQLNM